MCELQPFHRDDLPDDKGPFFSCSNPETGRGRNQEAGARDGSRAVIEEEEQFPEYGYICTKTVEYSVSSATHSHAYVLT